MPAYPHLDAQMEVAQMRTEMARMKADIARMMWLQAIGIVGVLGTLMALFRFL